MNVIVSYKTFTKLSWQEISLTNRPSSGRIYRVWRISNKESFLLSASVVATWGRQCTGCLVDLPSDVFSSLHWGIRSQTQCVLLYGGVCGWSVSWIEKNQPNIRGHYKYPHLICIKPFFERNCDCMNTRCSTVIVSMHSHWTAGSNDPGWV